jgi:hypothetical protein
MFQINMGGYLDLNYYFTDSIFQGLDTIGLYTLEIELPWLFRIDLIYFIK